MGAWNHAKFAILAKIVFKHLVIIRTDQFTDFW